MELSNKVEFKLKALSKGLSVKDVYILVLCEKYGSTLFPLPITQEQETFVAGMMNPVQTNRPSLLESLRLMYAASGVIVSAVCINNLIDGEFKAEVYQIHDGEETVCDVSAGDAIILDMYFRVPIYVDQNLMKMASSNNSEHTFSFSIKSISKDMLKEVLADAVKNEQYEIASIIRDELKKRA